MKREDFVARLAATGKAIDETMAQLLGDNCLAGELSRPRRVLEAMRYATLGGGKRLRPFLVVETAALFSGDGAKAGSGALRAASAVEFVHCYSLVHDDLPAMDDDDLRRGRPTTPKAFDEATAQLAGDGLLTFAFDVLADEPTDPDPAIRTALVKILARGAGLGGMVGGQMLDLEAEGRFGQDRRPLALGEAEILQLQAMKTGALLRASVEMGAIIGRADESDRRSLATYGKVLGQAFQIADDLLDEEADAATVGKATGKDRALGKGTLIGLWGIEQARARLTELVAEAEAALAGFGDRAAILRQAARFVADRDR